MTGFGSATANGDGVRVHVELRSVNHRHLDARFRPSLPSAELEGKLLSALRARVERGHVDVRVTLEASSAQRAFVADVDRARAYMAAADDVADELSLARDLSLKDIVTMPGVIEPAASATLAASAGDAIEACFGRAVDQLCETRLIEGERLADDLKIRIANLRSLRGQIEGDAARQVQMKRAQPHPQMRPKILLHYRRLPRLRT